MIRNRKLILTLLIGTFAAATVTTTAAADSAGNTVDKSLQRTVVMAVPEWDFDLNPHTASYASEAQVLSGLYEGLFSYNPVTLEAMPALCESYKLSRDKKRWTFTLRENITFSNGEPITAQTIKDSWMSLLQNPDAQFASMLDCVQGVQAFRTGEGSSDDVRITVRDERTLVVHLNEATEHLPQLLCHHSFAAVSSDENVYSGAFVLDNYNGNEINLSKNQNYWDKDHVYIPGIKIIISDDEMTEATFMYNTGKTDWLYHEADVDRLIDSDDMQVYAEFGTSFYFFKQNGSVWDNAKFRRALIEAIPYDKLRGNYLIKAQTLIYPLSGYPDVTGFDDYDVDDAVDMMNAAREEAGIPQNKKLKLTIAVSNGVDSELSMANLLKDAWAPLGVDVNIQGTSSSRYFSSIPDWNADLFIYGWVGDFADPLAFLELFKGTSSLNSANYRNAEYDSFLAQAAVAETSEEHYKLLSQAEQLLLDEGEVIPLYHFVAFHVINTDSLGGWFQNPLDIHPFKYLYFKQTETNIDNLVKYRY